LLAANLEIIAKKLEKITKLLKLENWVVGGGRNKALVLESIVSCAYL
jgi:ribosome-associated protein YbcJ (S4-like RNA binding protein)